MEFVADLPTYAQFWAEIKRDSLVVIDDLWSSASNNEHVSNCFKVYSKKYKFSIAIVTQVSLTKIDAMLPSPYHRVYVT